MRPKRVLRGCGLLLCLTLFACDHSASAVDADASVADAIVALDSAIEPLCTNEAFEEDERRRACRDVIPPAGVITVRLVDTTADDERPSEADVTVTVIGGGGEPGELPRQTVRIEGHVDMRSFSPVADVAAPYLVQRSGDDDSVYWATDINAPYSIRWGNLFCRPDIVLMHDGMLVRIVCDESPDQVVAFSAWLAHEVCDDGSVFLGRIHDMRPWLDHESFHVIMNEHSRRGGGTRLYAEDAQTVRFAPSFEEDRCLNDAGRVVELVWPESGYVVEVAYEL